MAPSPGSLCRQAQQRGSRISSRRAYDRIVIRRRRTSPPPFTKLESFEARNSATGSPKQPGPCKTLIWSRPRKTND
jgi:hypothetical protein